MTESARPSPDALLAGLRREAERARRGRLKIYFGMCPGVGKTCAMLQDARKRQAEGQEVLVGVVETHGRRETAALLEGLPIVPRAKVEYRGTTLEEMDLEAILLWHPKLALVDELAHTNAPGSRHPRRYQDVLELLDAGIDVHTTLNVQHVESRRDTVAQITGAPVRETVPDSMLDEADEIVLIDLTPEQLRGRLAEGRVYLGEGATTAAENFFRESNLLALREMALRIVAEHVDRDLRDVMQAQRIAGPWKSGDRLLVAVSASPFSEKLIRYTRRLAGTMEASWVAVHIETARPLPEEEQARLARHLALARQLGAEVVATSGARVGEAILRVAGQHNVTQIVLGKPLAAGWLRGASPVDWLIRHSGEIDLHMIRSDDGGEPVGPSGPGVSAPAAEYAWAAGLAAAVTVLGLALLPAIGYQAVGLLYLLAVVLGALRLGRGSCAVLAAAGALLWNFLFIPPRFTLRITEPHDWMMFALLGIVALVTGHLTTRLRERERAERHAETRATALYRLTRALGAGASLDDAVRALAALLRDTMGATVAVLLRTPSGIAPHPAGTLPLSAKEESVAAWAFQRKQSAGRGTGTLPEAEALHLPLLSGEQCEGVLAVRLAAAPTTEQRDLLEAAAAQLASFVEKERALRAVREAQVAAQSERLQKALFDSVSHELKTPLAALAGLLDQPELNAVEAREAARRLTRTVDLLLDATRLESGLLRPRLEWCEPLELAREAVALSSLPAKSVQITSDPAELPAIRVDAGLVGQALALLLGNAATHAPGTSPIELHLAHREDALVFSVLDRGPGLPAGEEERVFAKFHRGPGAKPGGLGLGLAIARQLAELHGGTLRAGNRLGGGAVFSLSLPARESLHLPDEVSS